LKYINKKIVSGGGGYCIKVHDLNLVELYLIDTKSTVMCLDYVNQVMTYSTKNGNIRQIALNLDEAVISKESVNEEDHSIIMQSHFSKEECGLVIYSNHVYTCGDDDQLIQTNFQTHIIQSLHSMEEDSQLQRSQTFSGMKSSNLLAKAAKRIVKLGEKEITEKFESDLTINYKYNHIAMSHLKGRIIVKNLEQLDKILFELHDPTDNCECMEFSPDDNYLAIGSKDGNVYIYK
jgi:WD40 repeat protein